VIGLLTREVLSGDALGPDPLAPARPAHAMPPPTILGVEETTAEPPATPTPAPRADTRGINGWVDGVTESTPLKIGVPYELKFNVGQKRADSIAFVGGVGRALERALQEAAGDRELVTILVVLEPGDFTLYGVDSLEIVVPKTVSAPSKNTATFTIEAKKEGANKLNAIFYINGSLFQKITMTMQVGGQVAAGEKTITSQAVGLTLASAASIAARPRDEIINVLILAKDGGYQVILQGGGVARAFLKASEAEVAGWLKYARDQLKQIVHLQDSKGTYLYQGDNTSIDPDVHRSSLAKMATVGMYLFDELFYGNNGPDARALGDLIRKLSQAHQLNVQVVADRFFFPWSFLYDGDDADIENPSYDQFWGFKHVIEYLPEFSQSSTVSFNPAIAVGDTVDIAFVCNNGIDTQFGRPIVQGQREFLNQLPGVSVKDYPTAQDLFNLLKGPDSPPLIYFYCHAVSKMPDEGGGADDSAVVLTDGKTDVRTLKTKVRTSLPALPAAPLVFLNACESAELSPYLYDGLMPYFIGRGARGVQILCRHGVAQGLLGHGGIARQAGGGEVLARRRGEVAASESEIAGQQVREPVAFGSGHSQLQPLQRLARRRGRAPGGWRPRRRGRAAGQDAEQCGQ